MVKTAPHFGHLIFVSLATPAHPKEKTAKSANARKMLTHFFIPLHLLSFVTTEVHPLIPIYKKQERKFFSLLSRLLYFLHAFPKS